MKILIFDTETSGLPERNASITEIYKWPHILQLSYILFDQDNNSLLTYGNDYIAIDSTVEITESSQAIHNISREICYSYGKSIREILNKFNICLQKADIIVGHNISFDKRMIMVECIRNKIPQYFTYYNFGNKIQKYEYCTMKRSVELCKLPYKNKKQINKATTTDTTYITDTTDMIDITDTTDTTDITNTSVITDKKKPYNKKINYKYPTLNELYYALFNLVPNNLHDSMVDILITFRCYIKIMTTTDICEINNDIKNLFIHYKI